MCPRLSPGLPLSARLNIASVFSKDKAATKEKLISLCRNVLLITVGGWKKKSRSGSSAAGAAGRVAGLWKILASSWLSPKPVQLFVVFIPVASMRSTKPFPVSPSPVSPYAPNCTPPGRGMRCAGIKEERINAQVGSDLFSGGAKDEIDLWSKTKGQA